MTIALQDWGRTRYREAYDKQLTLVQQRRDNLIGDTLVFTEHEPVYTIGRRRDARQNLLLDAQALAERGIDLVETTRGGDITYHGPGQLVGYAIISLDHRRDLHQFLRDIEQALINALGTLGLAADRRKGLTGIWLEQRKIAAIGIAVSRWVSYHGFALNVDPNLADFGGIIPCGITSTEGSVTSLSAELNDLYPSMNEVKSVVFAEFKKTFVEVSD
ncbi:lipoyl(octanoyl) transferase LipB [Cerasicoccus arenae]|uniref:Octanoyltransferase n=1 Tax=Cerasicoccus arenae TaxID=424488 RepID=A0A8J3GEP8_9BACT|nr:lipoyl(octanoyl) transferase LipB [Cerasicoccus arenae]MBK1857267.1 lipoyl(octanoyl) transferase LipB [Cerasicoccus arenae]GHC00368.1 octanoyltransferase [Cerasicoccus arenae]